MEAKQVPELQTVSCCIGQGPPKWSMKDRKIIPLPGGRSEVWKRKLFGFYSTDGKTIADRQKAVCCVCYSEIPYSGNTTNLCLHLAKRHSDIYLSLKAELEGMGKPAPAKLPGTRSTIGSTVIHSVQSMQMLPKNSIRWSHITNAIAAFLVRDLHSKSVTESDGFRYLVGVLEPRYQLDPSSIHDVFLTKKQFISAALMEKLNDIEACALTSDCWSADDGQAYCTLMVRVVDSNWEVKNYVLKTLEITADQTHANHIWDINKVLADWTLMPRIVYHQKDDESEAGVIDNPVITVEVSQMKVMAGVTNDVGNVALALKHLGMISLPCFANAVNTAVGAATNATNAPNVHNLIAKARHLVAHFLKNAKDRALLNKKNVELAAAGEGLGVLDLIMDVPNNWMTTVDMLGRLLEVRNLLNVVLIEHKERVVRELGLTLEDWYQLEELHGAMKAVSMAVGILGGDEYASCSMVTPLLHRLKERFMKITEHDTQAVFQYKTVVWEHLNPHYSDVDIQSLFNIATFLDPRFKDLQHLTIAQRDDVIQTVRQMVLEIDEAQQGILGIPSKQDSGEAPPTKRSRQRLQELDLLFGTMEEKDVNSGEVIGGHDLDKYLQEGPIDIKESPLEWWKRNCHRYPTIAKLARRYLCVPATAVPSECILSQDGPLFYSRRRRLFADEVDNAVFLNKNFGLVDN